MKIRTKRICLALGLLIAMAVATGLLWRKEPPQIITLPNSDQYRLVAAVWGTRHVPPSLPAKLMSRVPASLARFIPQWLANRVGPALAFTTPQPCLLLWFRPAGTNVAWPPPPLYGLLADEYGVISGGRGLSGSTSLGGITWLSLSFPVVPRRGASVQCCLFQGFPTDSNPHREFARVQFPNPLFARFPQWQPAAIPAVKTVGDLEVRLSDLATETVNEWDGIKLINGRQTRFRTPAIGEMPELVFKLDLNSPRGANERWIVQTAELSDATGNRVRYGDIGEWAGTGEYQFGPALWPDELAWRLKFEFKRTRGLEAEEIVTFKHVPIPAIGTSSTIFLTNTVHGAPIVLKQEFSRRANAERLIVGDVLRGSGSNLYSRITTVLVGNPANMALDFVGMTADSGWKLNRYAGGGQAGFSRTVLVHSIPTNSRTLDITWTVQKTRTVEFFVKPPKME